MLIGNLIWSPTYIIPYPITMTIWTIVIKEEGT